MTVADPLSLLGADEDVAAFCWAASVATVATDATGDAVEVAEGALQQLHELGVVGFDVPAFAASLRQGTMRWREYLHQLAERCDAAHLRVALADDCILNPLIDEDDLSGGVFGRRYNAVLDLANAPFTVGDVQELFAATAVGLAENKITWGHQGLMFAGNFALGAAGGFFGVPGAGAAGRYGSDFFLDRIAQVDQTALATARLLAAVQVMIAGDDCQNVFLVAAWQALVDELIGLYSEAGPKRASGQSVSDLGCDMQVLEAAEKEMRALIDARHLRGSRRPMPDVRGWNGLAASHLLELLGYSVSAQDAFGSRGVWNKEGWQVVTQTPSAGSTAYKVGLGCRKFSDPQQTTYAGIPKADGEPCPKGHAPNVVAPDGRCWICQPI